MSSETPGRGVEVDLDQTRRIRYPMAAVSRIEERFDSDLMAGEGVEPEGVQDVIWLIWLGLQYGEPEPDPVPVWERAWNWTLETLGLRKPAPELTEERVAEYVDLAHMDHVLDAVNEAMGGARENLRTVEAGAGKTQEGKQKAS